jgi:transposase
LTNVRCALKMSSMAIVELTSKEREELHQVVRHSRNGRVMLRAQALLRLDGDESANEVAEQMQVTRQALYALAARFAQRSELCVVERLADAPRSGRPGRKSERVQQLLPTLLAARPADYGLPGFAWTARLLKHQVERETRMTVSEPTIRLNLHALSYRYKRSRYVLARRAPHWRQAKGGCNVA